MLILVSMIVGWANHGGSTISTLCFLANPSCPRTWNPSRSDGGTGCTSVVSSSSPRGSSVVVAGADSFGASLSSFFSFRFRFSAFLSSFERMSFSLSVFSTGALESS